MFWTPGRRTTLATVCLLVFGALMCGSAFSQFGPPPPPPPSANEREVFLIRQDQSDCFNGNVSGQEPSRIGGTAWVVRGSDGKTTVKVAITASPNTTYHFFLKCVRLLGDIKTFDEGEGYGSFSFSTNEIGSVFAFDMYPEGAPAGNKFQSMEVKF